MKKRKRSLLFIVSLPIAAFALISLILSRKSTAFAKLINASVGSALRSTVLTLSNNVPFSFFEFLLFLSPAIPLLLIYLLKSEKNFKIKRRFYSVIAAFLLIFSIFTFTFGVGFGIDTEIAKEYVSEEDLSKALMYLSRKVNSYEDFCYPDSTAISAKLYSAYSSLDSPFLSLTREVPVIKKIKNTRLASRLGILGNYSFLTSEISVNFSAPEYTSAFSAAHEMAHLFGISGEAEASFFAFRASLLTNDAAIAYSAYLTAFEYVGRELFSENPELYHEIYSFLSEKAKDDLLAYRKFYYGNHSLVRDSADMANGILIDIADKNGESGYDSFTKILVAYLISEKAL